MEEGAQRTLANGFQIRVVAERHSARHELWCKYVLVQERKDFLKLRGNS